jgi:predicted enzyme related to lactoylglutathione lyase
MGLRIETVTIDAVDPVSVAAFWCAALGWEQRVDEDGDIWIEPGDDHPEFDRVKPLLIVRGDGMKPGKNRLHFDLIPDDQEREVERLESLGASRPDIGQTGNESWVVLADPEGNEFCVLDEPDLSDG